MIETALAVIDYSLVAIVLIAIAVGYVFLLVASIWEIRTGIRQGDRGQIANGVWGLVLAVGITLFIARFALTHLAAQGVTP